jgi:predicted nucleic acid-binding protein
VKHVDAAKLVDVIAPEITTLDLAVYEAGNAIWKQAKLLKLMSDSDARATHKALSAFISRTSLVRMDELDQAGAMDIALENGSTYYDACYVVAARSLGLALATEDKRLAAVSKVGKQVISWKELVSG